MEVKTWTNIILKEKIQYNWTSITNFSQHNCYVKQIFNLKSRKLLFKPVQ